MDFVWYLRPWQGCVLIYDRTVVRYRRHDDGIVEERGIEGTRRRERRKEGSARCKVAERWLTCNHFSCFAFRSDHPLSRSLFLYLLEIALPRVDFSPRQEHDRHMETRRASPVSIHHAIRKIESLEEARAERSLRCTRRETNVTWWCMRNPFCNRNRYRDVSTQPRTGLPRATSTDFRSSPRNLAA